MISNRVASFVAERVSCYSFSLFTSQFLCCLLFNSNRALIRGFDREKLFSFRAGKVIAKWRAA